MKLRISNDLVLGADFVTSTAGIFATKGQGKSYIAQVMAEEMLEHGQVIIAIDPTDAWSGLLSSADGKREGYPILVIGGDHGHLKLDPEPGAGVRLAEAIVAERFSCVICTDGLDDTLAIRYVREVLQTLFRKNRESIHVFVDECDIFAPQQPKEEEDYRCIRALSHVVRRGRKKGIGTTLITQRPAELNASVRTMVEMLFVLGMLHNLDIDAVEKWMRLRKKKRGSNAAFSLQEEMIDSLDRLQQGDAWVWAPRLKLHKRFRARAKRTFDSGATPKPGQKKLAAKRLAPVDIQRLGAAIADAAKRQKENDPTELKRQVAALRRELDRVGKGQDRAEDNEKANHAENIELRSEVAALKKKLASRIEFAQKIVSRAETVLNKHDAAVSRHHQAYQAALESYTTQSKAAASAVLVAIDDLRTTFASHGDVKRTPPCPSPAPVAPPRRDVQRLDKSTILWTPGSNGSNGASAADPNLQPAHLRLLSAIGWWEAIGVPSPDLGGVAFIAGTTTKSSAFNNNRSRLRAAGYIAYPEAGRVVLTEAGRKIAPPPSIPLTNDALHDAVLKKVTPAVWRLLTVLIEAYPNEVSLEDLAKRAGTSTSSSAFNNNRSWLRARELSTYPRTGFVRAAELLFPEAS